VKKRLLICLALGLTGAGLAIPVAWAIIRHAAQGRTFAAVAEVPARHVALVLGCARTLRDGRPNQFFLNRMAAARDLYQAGKVQYILVSGDNHIAGYDEPTDMKESLVALGVPEDRIYCDYAGFSTLDSVVRAQQVFGQQGYVIVSQDFHNQRAIFIARHHGIDAVGFDAAAVDSYNGFRTNCREQLARVKAVLDVYLLRAGPKFGGPAVTIPGVTG